MHARIENFQSHADTQVEIEGFTVILGPSNHGKSALVRAVAAALRSFDTVRTMTRSSR
jgi:AAA15 family ATPase/GTPase